MKYLKYICIFLLVLVDSYIIYQASLDSVASSDTSKGITDIIVSFIDFFLPKDKSIIDIFGKDAVHAFIRKAVGHFGLFFVIGILSYISFIIGSFKKVIYYILHVSHGILLALLTEFIQLFKSGRSGNFKDVGIDCLGYLISTILLMTAIFIYFKRKETTRC